MPVSKNSSIQCPRWYEKSKRLTAMSRCARFLTFQDGIISQIVSKLPSRLSVTQKMGIYVLLCGIFPQLRQFKSSESHQVVLPVVIVIP